jgi:hypothetical protein
MASPAPQAPDAAPPSAAPAAAAPRRAGAPAKAHKRLATPRAHKLIKRPRVARTFRSRRTAIFRAAQSSDHEFDHVVFTSAPPLQQRVVRFRVVRRTARIGRGVPSDGANAH